MLKLKTPIEYVKGVGPARGELLQKELNIFTVQDLIQHYPFRYVDKSQFYKINQLSPDMPSVQFIGKLGEVRELGSARAKRLIAQAYDDTGRIELIWFKGIKWVKSSLKPGGQYVFFGKPSVFNGNLNVAHPEIELVSAASEKRTSALQPVYSTTEKLSARGLNSKGIEKLVKAALPEVSKELYENIPPYLHEQYRLMPRGAALQSIHFPESNDYLRAGGSTQAKI